MKKSSLILGLILTLLVVLILSNPFQFSMGTQVELGSHFNKQQTIKSVLFGHAQDVHIQGHLNPKKLGKYQLTYQYGPFKTQRTYEVIDTKAPRLVLKKVVASTSQKLQPKDFVKQVIDQSPCKLSFITHPNHHDPKQTITIQAKDQAGNVSTKKTTLSIQQDVTPPTIDTHPIYIQPGQTPNFIVTDDSDPKPKIHFAKDELSTVGKHLIQVKAQDQSHNQTTQKVPVIVYDKVAYLTFDDGPSPLTPKVLDVLSQYNAKATFFTVGFDHSSFHYMKDCVQQGHTVALHSMTHQYSIYTSAQSYFNDLNAIKQLVKDQTGIESHYVRFPGGSSNTISKNYATGIMSQLVNQLTSQGYRYYDWNVSSGDAASNSVPVETIIASCQQGIGKPEAMILFHDSATKTTSVQALPKVIEAYQNAGYCFKAIDDDAPQIHHSTLN